MAGIMLEMAGKASKGKGYKKAKEILESGKAYEKMVQIITLQGKKVIDPKKIKIGKIRYDFKAKKSGVIKEISNMTISKIARVAGAPEDEGTGIYLYKHIGDKVKKGEVLYTIYCHNKGKLEYAKYAIKNLNGFVIK
jgi:AMP phosphorylase